MRLALVLLASTLAACGAAPTTEPPTNLGVANLTSVTVTLFVNGNQIGDVAAGGVEPSVGGSALPPLPWKVEARSPSGWILGTMTTGSYATDTTFSAVFDDLACGRLTLWTGDMQPASQATPASDASPGTPIPCGP